MRRWVPGMSDVDNAIVEFLQELGEPGGEPVAFSPRILHRNLVEMRGIVDCAPNTVSRHLKDLADAGVLIRLDEDAAHYVLSDMGWRYPDDLTEEEREQIEEAL